MPSSFHGFNELGLLSILRSVCHCLHRQYLCTRKASWNMRDIGFGVADFKAIPTVCQVQKM